MFGRVHRPLCRLPRCKTSSPSCILRNASEPSSPLCRLVPATLVGPLWPSGGLLVQGTKLARLTRVTAARPHSFSFVPAPHSPSCSALLTRLCRQRRPSAPSRRPQVSNLLRGGPQSSVLGSCSPSLALLGSIV
jgi:hypothetical protein